MTDDALRPRQVADELGVSVRTVQRWISSGHLPATRVGARMRVSRSSLRAVAHADRRAGPAHGPRLRPIHRLLIANRGEIVVRVARTARRLGIDAVGVHALDDRPAEGVERSLPIGSYLDADAILAAARQSGADAIHPGYGFLAESPDFAEAVEAAGVIWVGPPRSAIVAMGDKAAARRLAAEHGVPVLPGYDGEAQHDERLTAEAARIGFPLLVKPSAGGGGKGMRAVRVPAELPDALGAARREARRAFGDDRLILERLLEGPRHVEVQVLLDAHGGAVHLGERDCSTQRRNQKVIEESPAPSVDPALRARLGEAAVGVARAAGYVNAGTVEFLVGDGGGGGAEFWFLEMNTRLQVEHPVTEAVTGRDLVADQLRIATGASLGFAQRDVRLRGHAIEARLYAEDPEAGFLPAAGRILHVGWPTGVRVDTGVKLGDQVSDRYDPMLAKIVATGSTRAAALRQLRAALDGTVILGVRTNLRLLRWITRQTPMRDGEMRTDWLEHAPIPPPEIRDEDWEEAAAALMPADEDPWAGGWRLNAPASIRMACEGTQRRVVPRRERPEGERSRHVVVAGEVAHVDVEGRSTEFRIAAAPSVEEAVRHAAGDATGRATLTAPMPGRVIAVRASVNEAVAAHQPVVVIEAMKMEHAVVAPFASRLVAVSVREGQQVQRGDVLAELVAASTG